MLRAFSVSDALFTRSKDSGPTDQRLGVMAAVDNMSQLRQVFGHLLERFPYRQEPINLEADSLKPEAVDVINIALRPPPDAPDDERLLRKYLVPFVDVRGGKRLWAAP